MSGLVLKLGPKERVLINGAVIENGDKRSKLNIVTPNANILRLRDAIHPSEVNSPVKRVCYTLQLVLSGEVEPADAKFQLLRGLDQLAQVFKDEDSQGAISTAISRIHAAQFYAALRSLKGLMTREQAILKGMG